MRITINSANVKASENTETSHDEGSPFIIVSHMPIRNAPSTAPGMEPIPPNTAATNALSHGIAPAVGVIAG